MSRSKEDYRLKSNKGTYGSCNVSTRLMKKVIPCTIEKPFEIYKLTFITSEMPKILVQRYYCIFHYPKLVKRIIVPTFWYHFYFQKFQFVTVLSTFFQKKSTCYVPHTCKYVKYVWNHLTIILWWTPSLPLFGKLGTKPVVPNDRWGRTCKKHRYAGAILFEWSLWHILENFIQTMLSTFLVVARVTNKTWQKVLK